MMRYEMKSEPHTKLPSFNELTSNFANNLSIGPSFASFDQNQVRTEGEPGPVEVKQSSQAIAQDGNSPEQSVNNAAKVLGGYPSEKNYSNPSISESVSPTFKGRDFFKPHNSHIPFHQSQPMSYQDIGPRQEPRISAHATPPKEFPTLERFLPPEISGFRFPPSQNPFPAINQPQVQIPQGRSIHPSHQEYIHQQQLSQGHPHDPNYSIHPIDSRRLSMPLYPPERARLSLQMANQGHNPTGYHSHGHKPYSSEYPVPCGKNHEKNDSYDSQTSLSTLADIASSRTGSGPNELESGEYKIFLDQLESVLLNFEDLNSMINEINNDFHTNLENSRRENLQQQQQQQQQQTPFSSTANPEVDDVLPLKYEYPEQTPSIKVKYVKQFLNKTPMFQLFEGIRLTHELNTFFHSWMAQRELESSRERKGNGDNSDGNRIRREKKVANHVKSASSSSSKGKKVKGIITEFPSELSPSKRKSEDHSRIAFQPQNPGSNESSQRSPTKRRKHSRSSSKPENVTLVVKPLKPVSSISQKLSSSKEAFQEDLSRKTDQKCKQCGSSDTPEWRRGPYGTRSLCNACGLFFGKLTKKVGIDEATRIMVERTDKGAGNDRRIPNEN